MTGSDLRGRMRWHPRSRQDPASYPTVLRIAPARAGRQVTLTLSGDIDLTAADQVRDAAARNLRGRPACLTLDLRAVSYCDCAGARALRDVLRQAAASGSGFRILSPRPPVRRIFTLLDARDLLAAIQEGQSRPGHQPHRLPHRLTLLQRRLGPG